jgi:molybdate transport system substrate-binding protein
VKQALCLLLLVGLLVTGGASARSVAQKADLTVFAASSLTNAFPRIDRSARYSFGGSNALAAQIRLGAPADVFASANMALPTSLEQRKLCSKPVVFARNAITLIVPRSNPANIRTVYDLRNRGVKLVIAAPGVPVGAYTIHVLKALKLTNVLEHVVSRENDVREVLAKVALNEADAGFVYGTDALTVSRRVHALSIPARAQPRIRYGICVVASSSHKAGARAFVKRVLGKAGRRILTSYGFLPPVRPRR